MGYEPPRKSHLCVLSCAGKGKKISFDPVLKTKRGSNAERRNHCAGQRMQKDEIIAQVNEVFVEEFEIDAEALTPEAQIFQELGLDSLDIVDLIVALQKKFGVNFRSDERIREIRSLNDLHEFVIGLVAELK